MGTRPIPTPLNDIIGTFKSLTQNEYADHVRNNGWPPFRKRLWQLRFHDHIIRNETELNRIRRYIIDNPKNWAEDENNPENIRKDHETDSLQFDAPDTAKAAPVIVCVNCKKING